MLHLTQQERTVLLFLAAVVLVGSLLQIVSKKSAGFSRFFQFTEQRYAHTKINLNTADLETLKKISYIGDSTARAILEARRQQGGFTTVDDLLLVKGIGPRKLEIIKPYLEVAP